MTDYYLQRYIYESQKRKYDDSIDSPNKPDDVVDKSDVDKSDTKAHMEINRPDSPVQRELLKFMIRMCELDSIQERSENILKELNDRKNDPYFISIPSFIKTFNYNTDTKNWAIMEKLRLKMGITHILNQLDLDAEVNKFEFKTRNFIKLFDAIKKLKIPRRFKQEHIKASIIDGVSYEIHARYRYDDFYIVIKNVHVSGKWFCKMYVDY